MTRSPISRRAALGLTALTHLAPAALNAQSPPDMMRPDVMGRTAAVTSDHALASAAGMDVLRRGGNAVDAAITMAAVLAVTRPHMNGVGGDAFLLIREAQTGRVFALNGSGRSGSRATPAFFAERNLREIPGAGILSVSVPGAVRAWADALERFGTITLAQALAPAIEYAEQGFPVSTRLSLDIEGQLRKVSADTALARVYLVNGKAPLPGTILVQRDMAGTLRALAQQGPDALYRGSIARRITEFMGREGGLITADDLARHTSSWQEPLSTTYMERRILAFPPNTQGATFLQMLNLAEQSDLTRVTRNGAEYIHLLAEGSKLAYGDRDRHIADPEFANVPVERLLSKEYAKELAQQIRRDTVIAPAGAAEAGAAEAGAAEAGAAEAGAAETGAAGTAVAGVANARDGDGDTVYLGVIDKDGNAVSMIQSLFASFGSGRLVPGTGIVLHNRGSLYTLDASHPNVVAPGKRPYHTLCPAMALGSDGSLVAVFGTPGGDGQPQTLVQILNNVLRFGLTPQQAVEAPRWRVYNRARLAVEPGIGADVRQALERLGHRVNVQEPSAEFGGAQMIVRHASGALMTGADPRREAYAIVW